MPNRRKEKDSSSKGISSKKQKQSENGDFTFTDREVEAFLCHLSDEKLVDVVKENKCSLRMIGPEHVNSSWPFEFLKLFGNKIKWLKIIYEEEYNHFNQDIEKVVLDRCIDSLQKIHLMNAERFSMFEIDKPFKHVTEAILETGTICSPFSNIPEWFPKLRSLKIIDLKFHSTSDHKIFGNRLCSKLEKLEIQNLKLKNFSNSYIKEIAVLVQNRSNLNYISISNQEDVDELLGVIAELNPNLPNIYLDLYLYKPVGTVTIHLKSLNRLDFNSGKHIMNISTDEIDYLYRDLDGETFDEKWLGLIENNKTIRKINVQTEWESDEIESKFINLVKTSTKLQAMGVMTQFAANQIKDLVSCCGTLNKIWFNDESDLNTLTEIFDSLEPKWKPHRYDHNLFEKMNAQEE